MFEPFSGSYYLGRLYVEPHDGATPAIARQDYKALRQQLYGNEGHGSGPVVMKLDQRHFPVTGVPSVPAETLAVPPEILSDSQIENPPSLREVLLATADRAEQLLSLIGSVEDRRRQDDGSVDGPAGDGRPTGI
ncbi:DUF5802 family protein [Halorhabdus tiamatea]|nr:DUF5802 family protein [Halorhabdus tiamatea]CCQ32390.1 conserved hypothetical protein [Halorhabdus tiamatea SARL4B]